MFRQMGHPASRSNAETYFAASMLWRAGVHNWSGRSIELAIELGPYLEMFHQYLCGLAEFPKYCMLGVALPPPASDLVSYVCTRTDQDDADSRSTRYRFANWV